MVKKRSAGLLRGKKINKRHSTYIPLAGDVILQLKKLEDVTKISLGIISRLKPSCKRIKVSREKYGSASERIKILCRGTNAVQTLMVYGSSVQEISKTLESKFSPKIKVVS